MFNEAILRSFFDRKEIFYECWKNVLTYFITKINNKQITLNRYYEVTLESDSVNFL